MMRYNYASSVQHYWLLHPPTSNLPPSNPSLLLLPSYPADPSTPRNVTVTRVFQDGVELNWLPPTEPNGEVHYVIEYKREDSGNWTSVNTTSDSTHYNLTELHSGTNYTIRVVAVNMMKQASFTMSSTATPTTRSTATPTPRNIDEEGKEVINAWWELKLTCIESSWIMHSTFCG